jgi:protein phosphatase 1 regulatory subunit 7
VEHIHEQIASLAEIDDIGEGVKRAVLRQNRIEQIVWVPWLRQLEELDLYDNGLRGVGALETEGVNLRCLDLSFNRLERIEGVEGMSRLEELYLISNGIQQIEGLPASGALRLLELGANRIKELEGLEAVPKLQQLFLGQNRLGSLAGMPPLSSLRVLSVQSNQLDSFAGLEACPALEELYLSHNRLASIDLSVLSKLPALRILDVSGNPRISEIPEGLESALPALEEFWASDCGLSDIAQIDRLRGCTKLTTIYAGGGNPWTRNPRLIAILREALPQLKQIDGTILSWD